MKKIINITFLILLPLLSFAQPSSSKLIKQGVSLHDQGKYMEAISCYQQALRINPSSISAMYEMSLTYLAMEDYDNAINRSSQVINLGYKPSLVDAYVVKGTALAAQDKVDEAIELFKEAIKRCGDEYLLHYNLGLSYYNEEENELALIHLRKALEKEAMHADPFLLYAYVLNDLGKWVESFYAYHFFLLLEPNTQRSVDAFIEMSALLEEKLADDDARLTKWSTIDRKELYNKIQAIKPKVNDLASKYNFFEEASKEIFTYVGNSADKNSKDLFWTFLVPIYSDILASGHFQTYCRYISVACFPASHAWWESNKEAVDSFVHWSEKGKGAIEKDNPHADSQE